MGIAVSPSASFPPGNMSVETKLQISGQPGYGSCKVCTNSDWRREIVWNRTEAAARTRSDADFVSSVPPSLALQQEAGNRVEPDGSCCSGKIGRGLRLRQYRPQQEAGNRVEPDGSCCSDKIGRGLRLLQYRPQQEAGNRVDLAEPLDRPRRSRPA